MVAAFGPELPDAKDSWTWLLQLEGFFACHTHVVESSLSVSQPKEHIMIDMEIDTDNVRLVGHVGVDSGQMMVGDPCYLDRWGGGEFDGNAKPPNGAYNYDGACRATLAEGGAGVLGDGRAAVSSTGFGDGQYPVHVEYDDTPGWGRRVKRLIVTFIEDNLCDDCGEVIDHGGEGLCSDCYEETCESCGVRDGDVEYVSKMGMPLCGSCYHEEDEEEDE